MKKRHQKLKIGLLLFLFVVGGGGYVWLSSSETLVNSVADHDRNFSAPNADNTERVMPNNDIVEDENVVVELQQLDDMIDESERYLDSLDEQEHQLYQQELQAQQAITELEIQVNTQKNAKRALAL